MPLLACGHCWCRVLGCVLNVFIGPHKDSGGLVGLRIFQRVSWKVLRGELGVSGYVGAQELLEFV